MTHTGHSKIIFSLSSTGSGIINKMQSVHEADQLIILIVWVQEFSQSTQTFQLLWNHKNWRISSYSKWINKLKVFCCCCCCSFQRSCERPNVSHRRTQLLGLLFSSFFSFPSTAVTLQSSQGQENGFIWGIFDKVFHQAQLDWSPLRISFSLWQHSDHRYTWPTGCSDVHTAILHGSPTIPTPTHTHCSLFFFKT